jgi:LytS/YehU family sensor histidine kinase
MYEMMYLLYREHHQWPSFADIVKQLSPVYFWVDSMVTLLAYSAQVAYSFWCVNQRKMIASNQARQKFLSLKLMQLQGQLEPYFLLNSLEGIESLVTDAERPLAIRALARLSDLLRYVLASTQNEWLSVADELQFARDYLALQELRFGDGLQIEWVLEERHWQAYFCPPLLIYGMMEYVMRRVSTRENAQPFRVRIEASILENHIHFLVQYSDHNTDEESTTSDKSPEFTPVFTPELEAAKLRLYILYEHTAFIQNVRQSMLHSTANSADEPLKNGIMLAFPVKESRDD